MGSRRTILLFVAGVCLLAMASGIFEPTFNNYVGEVFDITADARGDLELPREFPGFMVAVTAGTLFFLGEVNLSLIGAMLVAGGMFGLAAFAQQSDQYGRMVAFLVLWSTGAHLTMPVVQSLALALAGREKEGEKLGKLGAVRSVAVIVGSGIVVLNFRVLRLSFPTVFCTAMFVALLAGVAFFLLKRSMPELPHGHRPRLMVRRRYGLYYVLCVLFGARKQIFITFGPWVLIRVYGQTAGDIALLWIVAEVLKVMFLPLVGRLIDRVGERAVLIGDAALLLLVCITYGFAGDVLPEGPAFFAVCGAFVLDLMLFPVQMARSTYLSKIAESRRDISGTLGLGVSIDHAVSIPIAMLGGRLWTAFGSHRPVFVAASCLALITALACSFIRIRGALHPELVEEPLEALEDIRQERL